MGIQLLMYLRHLVLEIRDFQSMRKHYWPLLLVLVNGGITLNKVYIKTDHESIKYLLE